MSSSTPTAQTLEKRFVGTWWQDTVAVLRKANEDRKLPVNFDNGRALLKAQLIAVRGLYEMEFKWEDLERLFDLASVLADADMTYMATYLEQLIGVGKASYKARGDYMTHIFEFAKGCKDLSTLPSVKNKKGETVGPVSADDQGLTGPGADDQTQPDKMSIDIPSPLRKPEGAQAGPSGAWSQAAPRQPFDRTAGGQAKQFFGSQSKKDDKLVLEKTVEFVTLVTKLMPEEFDGTENARQVALIEKYKPAIANRLTAIDEQREELQVQLDELGRNFEQVTEAFSQLKVDQDKLADFLGRAGLDVRTF
ncbi:hypothetical protein PFICI_06490 [Pestalotiopsis fici W106-1]|uniref:Uncharacterized protein n=1 Tax=Pestalotiopsis fici (strain W106-1 / CGMCC3.15140) TaxID=1229662 RepID=W3X5S7_PESFW|nr:uncharacterized protein PFICI_06490 [Pestalotiopsis fici W106-1]ETS81488.1 hypothetical protein PFICI_06490 [Pestalotiopsis fici W106-1]